MSGDKLVRMAVWLAFVVVIGAAVQMLQSDKYHDGEAVPITDITDKYEESAALDGTAELPIYRIPIDSGIDWSGDTVDMSEYTVENGVAVISDVYQLCDYMNAMKEKDILEFKFKYTGSSDDINAAYLADMVSCLYLYCNANGNEYKVRIIEFPGDRIVDAHRNGDLSKLREDEKLAYAKALELLEEARENADNMLELELAIHDILCRHITYDRADGPYVSDPNNPPRHLTVVGALLDGRANCQGYTDAFYTLASMAGFRVGRLCVETDDVGHMVNTVRLGDEWYIVDVTYADTETDLGTPYICYRLFNAGEDMCTEYWWTSDMEYHEIAEHSDENYFYNLPSDIGWNVYIGSFADSEELAETIAYEWNKNGQKEFHVALIGAFGDHSTVSDLIRAQLKKTGKHFKYNIISQESGENTFFRVLFE